MFKELIASELEDRKKKLIKSISDQKKELAELYDQRQKEQIELDKIIQQRLIVKEKKPKELEKELFLVEKKFNGFHCSVHKGSEVKIFSEDKKDLTKVFPTLVEDIKKLSDSDFIIDGELIPYGNDKILSEKQMDDSNVKLHVWDCLYYEKPIINLSLKERLGFLNKLKFTKRITNTERKIVTHEGLKSAIELVSDFKDSKEVIVKRLNALYSFGKTKRAWLKYKKLEEEGKEIEVKNFPSKMQSAFRKIMESGKWHPFVAQWHLRGEKSIHTDIRFKVNDHLEGVTLFTPPSITKPDLLTNGVKNIRGTVKTPQPKDWLTIQGRFERGAPGTTKEFPAYLAIVAKGKYTIKEVTDHKIIFELRSNKGKVQKVKVKEKEEYAEAFNKKLPDTLKQLNGTYSFHIAHIGDRYIILFDKIKS